MLVPSLELIRKEAEHCDQVSLFLRAAPGPVANQRAGAGAQVRQLLLLQSLAGGTGSGAGTRITHAVRDSFPSAYILNGVVWPSSSGEVQPRAPSKRHASPRCPQRPAFRTPPHFLFSLRPSAARAPPLAPPC